VDVRFSDDWQMYATGYALQTDSLLRRVGTTVTNDGSLENRGLELGVRGSGALRRDTRWWMNGSAALNRNRFDAATPAFPGHGVASGPIMVVPGDPVGGYYARPIIGMQDRNGNGRIDANTCPGAECEITLGEEAVFLGPSIPPRLASLALGVRSERGIALSMRLDHQGAVKRLNDTEAFRCEVGVCARLYDPATTDQQRAELAALRMEAPIGFVENADFVRLREVALTLTAPEHWVGGAASGRSVQLTVSGRNLHTWTGYSGLDPETSAWGGVPYGAVEFLTQPLPRTFSTRIDVRF
jgi:TonB-dependent starch-binding outer membrane protein SusC